MRPRSLTIAHESGHVVARHVLGLLHGVDLIEVPYSGRVGADRNAAARVGSSRTIGDVISDRDTAEREIVCLLAGSEAMRELHVDDSGGESDLETAAKIALEHTAWDRDRAVEMFDRCVERTKALVATERFQDLLVRLMVALDAVPAMSGRRAGELLRLWDPDITWTCSPGYAAYREWMMLPWRTRRASVPPIHRPVDRGRSAVAPATSTSSQRGLVGGAT
jgi:hypothetical protein